MNMHSRYASYLPRGVFVIAINNYVALYTIRFDVVDVHLSWVFPKNEAYAINRKCVVIVYLIHL